MTLELAEARGAGAGAPPYRFVRAIAVSLALHLVLLLAVNIGWLHRERTSAAISSVRSTTRLVWLGRGGQAGDAERSPERRSTPARRAAQRHTNNRARADRTPAAPRTRESTLAYVIPTLASASDLLNVPGTLTPVSAFTVGTVDRGTGTSAGEGRPDGRGGQGNSGSRGDGGESGLDSGSGITQPALVLQVPPAYTADALHARAQGTVTVEATVRTDGSVGDVRIIRSFNPPFGLDAEAVRTVQKWRFHPGTRRGRPEPMLVTIELTFGLR